MLEYRIEATRPTGDGGTAVSHGASVELDTTLAGRPDAFNPVELLLSALAACMLKGVERDVRGRLVVFFPGTLEQNNYRLLDARDGWNYMAVPISIHSAGGAA